MDDDDDLTDGLAAFVARHRLRLGLSPNGLAARTTTCSGTIIRDLESGFQTALRPKPARALARALELDDPQTDRFLFLAGCAPNLDWQALAEGLLGELGYGEELRRRAAVAYASVRPIPPRGVHPREP